MAINEIILYALVGLGGLIVGVSISYGMYKNKVLDVLDYLKNVTKTLDDEQYNYFRSKLVKQDSERVIMKVLKKFKRDKKERGVSLDD